VADVMTQDEVGRIALEAIDGRTNCSYSIHVLDALTSRLLPTNGRPHWRSTWRSRFAARAAATI